MFVAKRGRKENKIMFEAFKTAMKIRRFRKYNSTIVDFNADKHTFKVGNGRTTIELSFKLMYFDALYVAFSGDGVCSDADCMARITELLWNYEFPLNFPKVQIDALVEQVRKVRLLNMIPETEKDGQAELMTEEKQLVAEMNQEQEAAVQEDEVLQEELNKKIYFRDMHDFVMGDPNHVRITLRQYKAIDR